MAENQFLPFATGDGANTLAFADYATEGYLEQGFQAGIAQPYDINTVLRQVTTVAAGLGQFTADNQAANVLDDGIPANFETKFTAALKGVLSSSSVHFGVATGTGDAMVVSASPPLVATAGGGYQPGSFLVIKTPASPNASTAPTVNGNSIANIAIVKSNAQPLAPGDLPASTWRILFFDGIGCYMLSGAKSDLSTSVVYDTTADTSTNAATILATASPAVTTRRAGYGYIVFPANACAGATQINVGFGLVPFTRYDASALVEGDYVKGQPLVVIDDGTQMRLTSLTINELTSTAYISQIVGQLPPTPTNIQIFSAPGAIQFTVPADVYYIDCELLGAGGGGSSGTFSGPSGAGGGAGAYCRGVLAVEPGQVIAGVVGQGGTGAPGSNQVGTNGTSTTFGTQFAAPGASTVALGPGVGVNSGQPGGATSTGGLINLAGANGGDGAATNVLGGSGGATAYGAGGRGGAPTGENASNYGTGGGGAYSANGSVSPTTGGNGAAGVIIIRWS